MSVDPFYYPPSTGSGWSCGQCGAWVPYNTVHYCGAWRTSSVPPPTPPDRVADALERMAAALEKIAVIEGYRPADPGLDTDLATLREMLPSMEGHEDNCPCSVGRAHAALARVEAELARLREDNALLRALPSRETVRRAEAAEAEAARLREQRDARRQPGGQDMSDLTWTHRFRSWLAGKLFLLAGKLDESYDVWLDDAPRRRSEDASEHGDVS